MMSNKQIIELVAIVLLALVGYKFISSGIQENKEKAVLQEKFNLDQKTKEPLNQCLDKTEMVLNDFSDFIMSNYEDYRKPGVKELCEGFNKSYATSHNLEYKPGGCSMTLNEASAAIKEKKQALEQEKQDCYMRYK